MEKTTLRELTFEQLFLAGFYKSSDEKNDECRIFLDDRSLMGEEELGLKLDENAPTEEEKAMLAQRSAKILSMVEELDSQINAVSDNWKTNRMPLVDLNILRLALYEMKYDEAIPLKVAINEAVELAKKYGGEASPRFINAILGKLARE